MNLNHHTMIFGFPALQMMCQVEQAGTPRKTCLKPSIGCASNITSIDCATFENFSEFDLFINGKFA